MTKTTRLTKEGLEKLKNELEYLRTTGRTDIAEKIRVARGYGDLSENSEYDEAKNEQAKIEARIIELEKTLENVEIIEDNVDTDTVAIGVTIYDIEYDEELVYKMVGSAEADPLKGYISDNSPVGKALIGAKVGDEVVAEAPAGELRFKILSISK